MKGLMPIILILVAVGLFFLQINPRYSEMKMLRAEAKQYDNAIKMAEELKEVRASLETTLQSFSRADLDRLDRFLPRHLDTVRVILDVDSIASRQGLRLENLDITDDTAKPDGTTTNSVAYNTVGLSFRFTSSYTQALQFMNDLERSLRIMDVVSTKVTPSTVSANLYEIEMKINTYWINR